MAYFFPQAEKLFPKLTKRAVLMALTVPEGLIMLTVALTLDIIGLICLILYLAFGIGIPISFLLDLAGTISIGIWTVTRSIFRPLVGKAVEKATEQVTKMAVSVGKTPGEPTPTPSPVAKLGGEVGKKGIQIGKKVTLLTLGGIWTILTILLEIIPVLGDILPMWTLRVIYELTSGTVSEI